MESQLEKYLEKYLPENPKGYVQVIRTFGVEVEKTMENHLVDPTEKAENAESSENVTDKRNQKYITPNSRLTIMVQQCAANTR